MMIIDIGTVLVANSLGVDGTDLFFDWQPEQPDDVIVLSDYAASAPIDTMSAVKPPVERPRLQVIVRRGPQDAEGAHDACRAVYDLVCTIVDMDINGTRYTCSAVQTPVMVGRDPQQRVLYACNFEVTAT